MGSNNRLQGKVTEQRDQQIRLSGPGWDLWGHAAAPLNAGQQATAVIRVEQVQLNAQPGPDTLQLQLSTSMYLGDKWEHVFRMSDPSAGTLRAFGPEPLPSGVHHLQLPPSKLWIYPS
jgi:iron(III) transport system ATP-binding protein